jgi:predicted NUDIX family NTP pyrophosphohydrolase
MKQSAGILLYRRVNELEVLLAHPGGPLFARRDRGWWTIPKGEPDPGEQDLQAVAVREFREEIGPAATVSSDLIPLGTIRQKGGKVVAAWAAEGDVDPGAVVSNTFVMQWPPRSGRTAEFPEVDRAAWYDLEGAREHINPAQAPFLDRLVEALH